jgi:succinate dehydrogenase / fumarate reductase membrane anchor subunit
MRTPLANVRGLGSAKEGTRHFWQQRLTAVANIPLVLFLVWLVLSLIGADHAVVAARLGSPYVAIPLALTVLSLTYHMRLGMQVVIEDYVQGELAKIVLIMANTFFAIAVGAICAWALVKLSLGA